MKELLIKRFFLLVIIVLLCLPFLQKKFGFFTVLDLKGAIPTVESPKFSVHGFFSGEYQAMKEISIKEHCGFKPTFIRLNNQMQFDLFNIAKANGVFFGRDGYLYEENYIKAYYGLDFIGDDSIRRQVHKLKVIQDSLDARGVKLLVVLAPGKGSFYPDYFPEQYDKVSKKTTNIETFRKYFRKHSISVLDANRYFLDLKSTLNEYHRLFSKTGIHWSYYGEHLYLDTLLKRLESETGRKLPVQKTIDVEKTYELRYTDGDIGMGLNLFRPLNDFEMSYPKYERIHPERNTVKVLTVGDSYYFGLFATAVSNDYFNKGDFWYYFKQCYSVDGSVVEIDESFDVLGRLLENEAIVIICTDANLNRFGFGFIDQVYRLFMSQK